jgi:antirestriction protein ArdC
VRKKRKAEIVMSKHLRRGHAKKTKSGHAPKTKTSLYEEITARIIADLEGETFPWAQPWGQPRGAGQQNAALGLPRNAATGKSYSGINILILWGRLFDEGFPCQSWLTFRQAISLGGTVRKGEHGVSVCYADKFIPKRQASADADCGAHPLQWGPCILCAWRGRGSHPAPTRILRPDQLLPDPVS